MTVIDQGARLNSGLDNPSTVYKKHQTADPVVRLELYVSIEALRRSVNSRR